MEKTSYNNIKRNSFFVLVLVAIIACNDSSTQNTNRAGSSRSDISAAGGQSGRYNTENVSAYATRYIAVLKDLEKVQPELDREKDRLDKLTTELMGGVKIGCSEIIVNKIELSITADKEDPSDVTRIMSGIDNLPTPDPQKIMFKVGFQDLQGTKSLEFEVNAVDLDLYGNRPEKLIPPADKKIKIGEIESITIEKLNPDFQKKLPLIYEINRYNLKDVNVKINGQYELFHKKDINCILDSQKRCNKSIKPLYWDSSIQNRAEYTKLRTSCKPPE